MQTYTNVGAPGGVPQPFPIPWQNPPFLPGQTQQQMPPQLQEALNNHFAALGQQYGGQFGMGGPAQLNGIPPGYFQAPSQQQNPAFPQLSFHQILAQQQQARAAARQQGISSIPGGQALPQNLTQNNTAPQQHAEGLGPTNNVPGQANNPNNSNTIVHEGQGPNGSH
ncbi:MAG: hypothetical protein Q9187_008095, partial [Circinaria calcarea]